MSGRASRVYGANVTLGSARRGWGVVILGIRGHGNLSLVAVAPVPILRHHLIAPSIQLFAYVIERGDQYLVFDTVITGLSVYSLAQT